VSISEGGISEDRLVTENPSADRKSSSPRLGREPWPLPDSDLTEVRAYDVQHLRDVVLTMEKIDWVCATGARVLITVQYLLSETAFPPDAPLPF
jgi:hypothetical protein